jgi:hypothetical protein
MKKFQKTLQMFRLSAVAAAMLAFVSQVDAQTLIWRAYNDHFATNTATAPANPTHANATAWNALGTGNGAPGATGLLKDITTGVNTPVTVAIVISGTGQTTGSGSGAPASGTPAGDWFLPYVNFGTSSTVRNAIQITSAATVTYTFTGCDPSKRYTYKSTSTRGDSARTDRWTLVTINAAASAEAHVPAWNGTAGILTSAEVPANIQANQAVINSGYNSAMGAMVVWNSIQPNADGTIVISETQYRGTIPGGTSAGTYGYASMAWSLEEYQVGSPQPPSITLNPTNTTVFEGDTAVMRVGVTGAMPLTYQWYKDNVLLVGQTNLIITLPNCVPADTGNYTVRIQNSLGTTNTTPARLTVIPDTNGPVVVKSTGLASLSHVYVQFNEDVDPNTALNTANYQVKGTGAGSVDVLSVLGATLMNNSNVLLTTSARQSHSNYTVFITNVTDMAVALNKVSGRTTNNMYHEIALVYYGDDEYGSFTNMWQYDETGNGGVGRDAEAWKSLEYNDSAWSPGWIGFRGYRGGNPAAIPPEVFEYTLTPPVTGATCVLTYYFRKKLSWPSDIDPDGVELRLRHFLDDGAIFNINGQEIFATNMPTTRPIYYTNLAPASVGNAWVIPATDTNSLIPGLPDVQSASPVIQPAVVLVNPPLVSGTDNNVIAVEVHQVNNTSTDVVMGLALSAVVPPFGSAVAPKIMSGPIPTNQIVGVSSNLNIYVDVAGTEPITYRWFFNTNTLLATQTRTNLSIASAQLTNTGVYRLVASNSAGMVTSAFASVTVVAAPFIVTHPVSVFTNVGANVTFTCIATGYTPIAYQWYKTSVNPTNLITGATSTNLVLNNVQSFNGGTYMCVASNVGSWAVSSNATLTFPVDNVRPTVTMAVGILRATNAQPTLAPTLTHILVTFSEGVDPTSATTIGNYSVTGPNTLTVQSALLLNPTNVLLITSPRQYLANYNLRVNNVKDASAQQNLVLPNTTFALYQEISLIGMGGDATNPTNSWKYTDQNIDMGTVWRASAFDDSSWTNGWGMFWAKRGNPVAQVETLGTQMAAPTQDATYVFTYYFRKHFTWPAGVDPLGAELRLRSIVDDGCILYLNGTEAWRYGLPTGTIVYTNRANVTGGDTGLYIPAINTNVVIQPATNIDNRLLVAGDNVVALELHQGGGGYSTDVYLNVLLTAIIPPIGTVAPPQITVQPTNLTVNAGSPASFGVTVLSSQPVGYKWLFNSNALSAVTNPLTIAAAAPGNQGAYQVIVTNTGGAVTSAVANLTVVGSIEVRIVNFGAVAAGGGFKGDVQTMSGSTFYLEYKGQAAQANWLTITNVVGDGTVKQLKDTTPMTTNRIYRLRITTP